ncbi:serine/threonine transporter SstT [Suttonella ornithocola]|uniref:Serine/threonine transporter SstT n=1 Tax=Suttonella ornithocola TaxID=279832 RepID=A0A380MPB7_9GAMM|nr:serine/threonine transporter SstT [Suttonella ornithocola]SUO94118.1 Na(+)/serine-threonine symporter [Suttonella ornithocola]
MKKFFNWYMSRGLVLLIVIGLIAGIGLALLGTVSPEMNKVALSVGILGKFFVSALKAVAPILVFVLVIHAVSSHQSGEEVYIKPIIWLYLFGTFAAALVAVSLSFLFPTTITLKVADEISLLPPGGILEVLRTLFLRVADNPIHALSDGNYIGILVWAALLGFALKNSKPSVKEWIDAITNAVTQIVRWVIRTAPIGIFGLVTSTIAETGFDELFKYGRLILVLCGTMLLVALVMNPLIVYFKIRRNPYPLVWQTLIESGIPAFFTRSSAANIPVNMALAKKLGLHESTYSISIPLGATINMAGAAITITILTLAATHTLNIQVDFFSAILLCALASLGACGASGVPGGSLLLIPMACSLFNIPDDISMRVVAVGMIIGVIQDSAETALNSSSDVLYTAAADFGERRKAGNA